jgi:hypothetical protein
VKIDEPEELLRVRSTANDHKRPRSMRGLKSPLAVSRLRLSPYREANGRNSSRAASLNSFSGSIAASPLFINSCSSSIVRFDAE